MGTGYTILEKFTESKTGYLEDNEDGIILLEDFVIVYDIASSYSYELGRSTLISRTKNMLEEFFPALPQDSGAEETFTELTKYVGKEFSRHGRESVPPEISMSIISVKRREIWQVGDVTFWECSTKNPTPPYHSVKPLELHLSHIRAAYVKHLLHRGVVTFADVQANDPGRDYVVPFLRVMSTFQNTASPYGYGAIAGTLIPSQYLHIYPIRGEDGNADIVLHTDGYPYTYPTLAEAEQALMDGLAKDPLCLEELVGLNARQQDHVSYGDRTYAKIRL